MERLTIRNSEGIGVLKQPFECERCGDLQWSLPDLGNGSPIDKLAEYEDLEDRLQAVYGNCDRLFEKVVEHLEQHSGVDFTSPAAKARLLTDEDVDRWEEYKTMEEQGKLIKLPCAMGDTVYVINKNGLITKEKVRDVQYRGEKYRKGQRFFINISALPYIEQDFGKTVFLNKEEAESALKELERSKGE